MSSLSFPDVNVWLALLRADHIHRSAARRWWDTESSEAIVFCRFTQIAVLRLLTTAAAMNNKPLGMTTAWAAYDRLFSDPRVVFMSEAPEIEAEFRNLTSGQAASPKLWADAYLTAFALQIGARVVTFDQALAGKAARSLLLS
jgi:toxin-antitoxin system PIN domain toxin